jgi:hypothetical protein
MTRLSSWNTWFSKLFGIPIVLFLLVMLYLDAPGRHSSDNRVTFIWAVMVFAFCAFGTWYSSREKFVWANEQILRVAGLFRRCEIPLSNVDRVDESTFLCMVIVRLKTPSAFGRTILFTPTRPFLHLFLFGPHPVTEELRELVRHASTAGAV